MAHSQADMRSVAACVTAVVAAYDDAAKLVERIKTAQQEPSAGQDMASFEESLLLGAPVVQGQYKKELQRHGDAYASGDPSAREDLKDIVINLQLSLLATLRMALLDNISLDVASLQRAVDTSRLDAIVCLSQLGERMASSSPSLQNRETPTPPAPRPESQTQNTRPESPPRGDSTSRRGNSSGSDTVNGQRSPLSPSSYAAKRESPQSLDRSVSREAVTKSTASLVPQPLTTTNGNNQANGYSSSDYNSTDHSAANNRPQNEQVNIFGHAFPNHRRQDSDQISSYDHSVANNRPQNNDQASTYGHSMTSYRPQNSDQVSTFGQSVGSNRCQSNDQISSYDHSVASNRPQNNDQASAYGHSMTSNRPQNSDQVSIFGQSVASKRRQSSDQISSFEQSGKNRPPSSDQSSGYDPSVINIENQNHNPNPNRNQSLTVESTKDFIAELEGPPPPRPRSEPVDDHTAGRQPEGNSVFVSADISSLLGPGSDPFEPEISKPLPPDPSTGKPMGLPPDDAHPHPQTSQTVDVTTQSGKQNTNSGASAMLSGLKHRAKRLTQNPYENKALNIQVPRSLNFTGLKRGLGITSTNTSQNQANDSSRPHTAGGMTYVTDLNPQLYLPSEENNYAGFCKGAWKMQNNVKKAFVLEIRPVGVYGRGYMWCCSKCTFELPPQNSSPPARTTTSPPPPPPPPPPMNPATSSPSLLPSTASWSTHPAQQILAHSRSRNFSPAPQQSQHSDSASVLSGHSNQHADTKHHNHNRNNSGSDSNSTAFDQSVHVHPGTGIRYRRAFLAKSHAHSRAVPTAVSGAIGSFGCIFCCSIMKSPAPVFGNLHAFLEHLMCHAAEEGYTEGSGPVGGPQGGWYPDPSGGAVSYIPSTELLTRTKCVVGRVVGDHEDFDVNIPPRVSEGT